MDEFVRLLFAFNFALKGNFKNLENSLSLLKQKKLENFEYFIINLIKCLMTNNSIKFKFNFLKEKLYDFFGKLQGKEPEKNLKSLKENIFIVINILRSFIFGEFAKEINYDKIFVIILNAKLKSGFVLKINSNGLNNFLSEFHI